MEYGLLFEKCGLDPNLQCDMDHSCHKCIQQENQWATRWIEAHDEGHRTAALERPVEIEIPA